MGGNSTEREISLRSGQAVLAALRRCNIDAHTVDAKDDVVTQLQCGQFDCVFNALHGRIGEGGIMQGVLDTLKLPYPGSGVIASALAMDKVSAKRIWQQLGLPVTPFMELITASDLDLIAPQMAFPVCIKPIEEGSSNGVTQVMSASELKSAYAKARQYDARVMVEPWIYGREFTVGILADKALPVVEICPPEDSFYDYAAKYEAKSTQYLCPCNLTSTQLQNLQSLALQAFKILGCKYWGRVDFMQDTTGQVYLTEVNTIPGMTNTSLLPKAAQASGIDFDALVVQILSHVWEKEGLRL